MDETLKLMILGKAYTYSETNEVQEKDIEDAAKVVLQAFRQACKELDIEFWSL